MAQPRNRPDIKPVTLSPFHRSIVKEYADEQFDGNFSAALRAIITTWNESFFFLEEETDNDQPL